MSVLARYVAGAAGISVLIAALSPPVEELAGQLFYVHMIQHLALMLVVPLLLAFAAGTRARLPSWLGPAGVGALFASVMWVWHIPSLYEAALANVGLHVLEHASFLIAGWFFWVVLLGRGGHGYLARLGLTFVTTLHSGALGALIALASGVLYDSHRATATLHGLTALEDQQLAGAVMWVPTGTFFLMVMLGLLLKLLKDFDRRPQPAGDAS
ncbi:MAG TPA: cytochrome c oxidase assembly protein [Actinomycetota bacterium]|nr:cytochrome c oxidase assembly protein [Actinomycetota bacterium]